MKKLLAVIGGSAVVALGAAAFAVGHPQVGPTQMVSSGTMSMGASSTQETPPTAPATTIAVPAVKAGS